MTRTATKRIHYATMELEGIRYAVIRENLLLRLCRRCGVEASEQGGEAPGPVDEWSDVGQLDREQLARHLIARRKNAELSQAELARRAGVRIETLNRIERGKTTPDFATIRKLVVAIKEALAQ
ncbi:MAG: helix-turn-helix transcriptional regulator [Phycisphaerae bacterium]|nr:helix-turn-helix transcriptional regulator [Phycisphaerae bacterium]